MCDMRSNNQNANCTVCQICMKSYIYDCEDEINFQKKVFKILKKKRLPKILEVSWLENLLKEVKKRPEHEYSKKYDQFYSQHSSFF